MYNSQQVADRIKYLAHQKHIIIKTMLKDCGLGANMMANMKTSMPKADSLAKIADYLGCSLDYLFDRDISYQCTNTEDVTNNHGIIGQINAPVTIKNGQERPLTKQEQDLLRIYNNADGKKQMEIMKFVYSIEDSI